LPIGNGEERFQAIELGLVQPVQIFVGKRAELEVELAEAAALRAEESLPAFDFEVGGHPAAITPPPRERQS